MRRTEEQIRRLVALMGVALLAAVEAVAQESGAPRSRRIVVSIPDHELAVIDGEQVVKIFPTAVGTSRTPSPVGSFRIVQRIPDPTWYTKGKVVGPGKANPLGTRWLGLSAKGYGIHGTNRPSSIGHNASHGCIRMRNHDVEELFTMVAVGDPVELYGTRTAEVERIFGEPEMHADVAAGQ
jgi:lipoprotein-anchoring transpeptidase ErfK/SrfK